MGQIWNQIVLTPLGQALTWLHGFTGSYGLAIILLAVLVKLILLPLVLGQTRWNRTNQALQPLLQGLQRRYANDPVRLNQEIVALYQRSGVNPMTGCVWAFILGITHLIVFIGLYQIVRGLSDRSTAFLWLPDLTVPNGWPLPAPLLNYLALPALLIAIQLIYQRTALAGGTVPGASLGPWLVGLIAAFMPAGLALFWLTNTLFDLLYHGIVVRVISSDKTLPVIVVLVLLAPAIGGGVWLYLILGSIWLSLYLAAAILFLIFIYLGCLISRPYKLQQLFYYFLPQLSAYVALYLAYRRWGDSWMTPLVAIIGVWLFTSLYAGLIRRLAPQLSLKARIAYQGYFGVEGGVKQLEQQLAALQRVKIKQTLEQAEKLHSGHPAKARQGYEKVEHALAIGRDRTSEEDDYLARAYLGLGGLCAAGQEAEAIKYYSQARQLGHFQAALRLAPLLARRGQQDEDAVSVYLEYLQVQRGQADAVVVSVLEQACQIKEGDQGKTLSEAMHRNEMVIQAVPETEWASYYLGLGHLQLRKFEAAKAALERARQLNPRRAATHYYLGQVLLQTAQPEAARAAFEESLRLEPGQPEAAFQLGQLLLQPLLAGTINPDSLAGQERLEAVFRWLNHALSLNKKKDGYFYYLGRAYLLRRTYPAAAEALQQAIKLNSQQPDYFYYLAIAQRELGQIGLAKEALTKVVALNKDYTAAHLLLADLHFGEGAFEPAASHYREVLRLERNHTAARLGLGRSLYELGDYRQALAELSQAPAQTQETLFYLARAQAKLGEFEAAINSWQRYINMFGPTAEALYYLGCAYANYSTTMTGFESRSALEQALTTFTRCLELEPARWQAQLQLGHVHLKLGHLPEARQCYLQAQVFQFHNPAVLQGLAQVAYLNGDVAQAQATFEQILRYSPQCTPAQLALGVIYEQQGNITQARQFYQQAGAFGPLGILCCQQGDYPTARQYLLQAQAAGDESDALLNYLGFALAQEGQYQEARQVWSQLQARCPHAPDLSQNLSRLDYLIGHEHVKAGQYAEAAPAWERYLAAHPEDEGLRQDLAQVYFYQGQAALRAEAGSNGQVGEVLQRAAQLARDNSTYDYYLALADLAAESNEAAALRLRRLLQAEPDRLEYSYHLGLALLNQDQLEEAQALLQQVLGKAQEAELALKARAALAGLLMRQERWQEAADLFGPVLEAEDSFVAVKAGLPEVQEGVDLPAVDELLTGPPAIDFTQTVIRLQPTNGPTVAPTATKSPQEAKTGFDVILTQMGSRKVQVIKAVCSLRSDLDLQKAKDLVAHLPAKVLIATNQGVADTAKAKLEAAGATVEIN